MAKNKRRIQTFITSTEMVKNIQQGKGIMSKEQGFECRSRNKEF